MIALNSYAVLALIASVPILFTLTHSFISPNADARLRVK